MTPDEAKMQAEKIALMKKAVVTAIGYATIMLIVLLKIISLLEGISLRLGIVNP